MWRCRLAAAFGGGSRFQGCHGYLPFGLWLLLPANLYGTSSQAHQLVMSLKGGYLFKVGTYVIRGWTLNEMNTVFAFHNKVFVKTQCLTWTPYFVGIVWTVDDMDSLFVRESGVGSLLNIFYPLTKWGIFDQIWPNFGAPRWGFWPKFFWKIKCPTYARE